MKPLVRFLSCWILVLSATTAGAQDKPTAKQATSVVAGLSPVFSARILEITGKKGVTQPEVWKFLIQDRAIRSGLRVVEVRNGRVVKEQTPTSGYVTSGTPSTINMGMVRIDSDAAFQIANKQAVKANVGFDSADYALRMDLNSGRPVWVLTLNDQAHRTVGTVFISSDSGKVVRVENLYGSNANYPPPVNQVPPLRDTEEAQPSSQGGGFIGEVRGNVKKGGYYLEKGGRTVGATLQEFFTGRRTIDRKYQNGESQD